MRIVGKIDVEKFAGVAADITTDEVVLTDTQEAHIRSRHDGALELAEKTLPIILSDPDYILTANKPNSAVLLKEFDSGNERFQLILRLKVESDSAEYKNSVITFMKLDRKRYNLYAKSKRVLYKRV